MTYHDPAGAESPAPWNLRTDGSGLVEQVLEYGFLAALSAELLRRDLRFEVLRADIDLYGHDLVVEVDGILRHIQLKGMVRGGASREVNVNTMLAEKPSGCVIWMTYDPATFAIEGWRWLGGAPGEKLTGLGDRVGKHSRPNSGGGKNPRPNILRVSAGRFTKVSNIAALADLLFGPASLNMLRRYLSMEGLSNPTEPWIPTVRAGDFRAIPRDLDWEGSVELGHLIDGYALCEALDLGDAFEYESRQLKAATSTEIWPGDAAELWLTLFLEHRRWRQSPFPPDPEMTALLDGLVRQLRCALTGEGV